MKFNKESRILALVSLLCITSFLLSFTKKEETYTRYQIERVNRHGEVFYVLVDGNGNAINFLK